MRLFAISKDRLSRANLYPPQMSASLAKPRIFKGDGRLWWIYIILMFISFVEVFSASSTLGYQKNSILMPLGKHLFFQIVAIGSVFVLTKWFSSYLNRHQSKFRALLMIFYLLGLGTQLLTFTGMSVEINGASRWVELMGISFQPSEIIRLGLIVVGASLLRFVRTDRRYIVWYWVAMFVPILMIGWSNMSTFVMLGAFTFIYAWVGRMPSKSFLKVFGGALVIGLIGFIALTSLPGETLSKVVPRASTWKSRLEGFVSSDHKDLTPAQLDSAKYEINDDNFQEQHAKLAIARGKGALGGVLGQMPGNSVERDILPQAFSDYIYAIIIEEWGLVGAIVIPLLYILLFLILGEIANSSDSPFNQLLLRGIGLLYVMQAVLHFMVSVGIGPVTGQTLPLISRGGTSYLLTGWAIGLAILVSAMEAERKKSGVGSMDSADAPRDFDAFANEKCDPPTVE
ncbi:MAG: FtsW/RodA/SpoVE family cell cycle protein [Porphyromonas sp.]|nr:FtsW/RodA/SpoVE family cell cycle protein [Porphyromonas sp.]